MSAYIDPDKMEEIFKLAVIISATDNDFRIRLRDELDKLSTAGRPKIPLWKAHLVRNTVEMIQTHHRIERRPGWRMDAMRTQAFSKAAEILGMPEGTVRKLYYKKL